jgi:hypothetical protein
MKRLMYAAAVLAVAALFTTTLAARQDKPAPAQTKDPKVAAEAASIEGKWHLTMPRMGGLAALSVLDLKLTGKKITGTLQSVQMGELPVKGEFSNNKLKFSIEINMGAQSLFADFEGKLKDGELNGTVTLGPMGEVEWKGTRPEK